MPIVTRHSRTHRASRLRAHASLAARETNSFVVSSSVSLARAWLDARRELGAARLGASATSRPGQSCVIDATERARASTARRDVYECRICGVDAAHSRAKARDGG